MPKKHGPVIAGFGYTGEDGLTYVDAEREYEAWAKMFPTAAKKSTVSVRHGTSGLRIAIGVDSA
jgi:hypothetical protein